MAISERARNIAQSIHLEMKEEYQYESTPEGDAETVRYYAVVAQGFLNVMGSYIDGLSDRLDELSRG